MGEIVAVDKGPWIVTVEGKTAVVCVELVHDGGMVEFTDAVTGEPRGCAGIHWWLERKHSVRYEGELPSLPDEGRWIT